MTGYTSAELRLRIRRVQAEAGVDRARTLGPAEAEWFQRRGRHLLTRGRRGNTNSLHIYELEQRQHRATDAATRGQTQPTTSGPVEHAILRARK